MSSSDVIAYPLSPMQQGLLFHSLAAGRSDIYIAQLTAQLDPAIDLDLLDRAWRYTVRRHEVLRTSFAWDGPEPVQLVHPEIETRIERHDWRAHDADARRNFLTSDRNRGFDLTAAPLMRVTLCDASQDERVLVWTHHHLLLDGRGRSTVMKDLAIAYDAYAAGREPDLPAPPRFEDYIRWLRAHEVSDAKAFWHEMFSGFDGSTPSIFGQRVVADVTPKEPTRLDVPVPPALQSMLRQRAREHGVTVNILIQAAWAIVLGRVTGRDSVVFGVTRSCRRGEFPNIGSLAGVVMNTLPHCVGVDSHSPWLAIVAQLRTQHVAMRSHELTPLVKVREWAGVDAASHFDSVIVFEEYDLAHTLRLDGRPLWRHGVTREAGTHYAVTLDGHAKPSLQLVLARDPKVCPFDTAARLRDQLVEVLSAIGRDTAVEGQVDKAKAGGETMGSAAAMRPPVAAAAHPPVVPASYAQQRLWFLDRLQGQSREYHMPSTWRLHGPLDTRALAQALDTIVARHESLRTRFVETDGELSQIIEPAMRLEVPIDDLSTLSDEAQGREITLAVTAESDRPFDLATGPLLRLRLLRLGPSEHFLITVVHHIVSDAWSRGVFVRELMALYGAYVEGRPDPLPPVDVQYADFAMWQRRYLTDSGLAKELNYWTRQLEGIPERLDLPTDRPRPPQQTYDAAVCRSVLSADVSAAVRKLAAQQRATTYTVLLSAFAVVLSRYSGQQDILVASPIANRLDPRLENVIGILINTLVLRVRVDRAVTFRDLLVQARNTAFDAYQHQDLPFERLVERLAPQRTQNAPPIVQVLLTQNVPDEVLQLPGLSAEPTAHGVTRVRFDLEVYLRDDQGRLAMSWLYNEGLFAGWRIEQMARHLTRVLEAMTADPDARLDDFDLVSAAERQALIGAWNAAPDAESGDSAARTDAAGEHERIDAAVDAWAHRTPGALAVLSAGERLTYRDLNDRADDFAARLRALGAGRGSVVAVVLSRTPSLVAALVAVLRVGAAYVPLDTSLPRTRLKFIVDDVGASIVLVDAATRDSVDAGDAHVLDLSERGGGVPAREARVRRGGDGGDAAYIIYTSGSTGTPKGVAVSHRAVMNVVSDMRRRLKVTAATRVFAMTNISFDIAEMELFLPLTSGAACWIAGSTLAAGASVLRELNDSGCSIVQATPSGWRGMLDLGWEGDGRVTVLTAGEPLAPALALALVRTSAAVWNLYGPSETTIYSTVHEVQPGEEVVPIGRPVANTTVFVLDARLRPIPHGVIGELYIGGEGVGIGYVNRPGLTASAFVADPFAAAPRRLYRSGDLVRSRPDGTLEFIGRRDGQVKLRGFRIELGEIEAAIRDLAGIRDAVVVGREDLPGELRLVAYVVGAPSTDGTRAGAEEMRTRLMERLPDYMIPSTVVWMAALPLTPSGKVDRRLLPVPEVETEPVFEPAETSVEKALVAIWSEVIGRPTIGRLDDFFALGGHSLAAMKMSARVWRDLRVELPFNVVFDRPVLADLAQYIVARNPDLSSTAPAM